MKKSSLMIACFAAAVGTCAAGADVLPSVAVGIPEIDTAQPVYTVSVAKGAVADLSTATIDVSTGGTITGFAGVTDGTLVKSGEGELTITVGIGGFTGPFHVMDGVVRATCANPLGRGTNYVHSGATLIADNSDGSLDLSKCAAIFFAGGEGAEGQHGQYVMFRANSKNIRVPFASKTILGGDTTWNVRSAICWDGSKSIDLQGHVLTINDKDAADEGGTLYVDGVLTSNPGGFIIDGMNCFNLRSIAEDSFLGNGYFKFINGAKLQFPESNRAKHSMEWRFILTDTYDLTAMRAGQEEYGILSEFPNTTWFSIGGLELLASEDLVLTEAIQKGSYNYAPFAIMGPFTGDGGITYAAESSKCRGWDITLGCPNNSFTGGVNLYLDSRLDLLGGGNALPAAGGDLHMATGGVLGLGAGTYSLPGAVFDGAAIVSNTTEGAAAAGAWTRPVVKKGEGVLEYNVGIGGPMLDIRGGTVRFAASPYASVSGLNKGMIWFADNKYSSGKAESAYYRGVDAPEMDSDDYNKSGYFRYTNIVDGVRVDDTGYWVSQTKSWDSESVGYSSVFNGSTCVTNATVRSIDIAYSATDLKKHPRYCVYTYTGYVWNDSTEDVVWTVASAFNDHQIWKLNGSQIYKMDSGRLAENNPERVLIQLTLKPGPNAIEVRTYNQYVSTPNFYSCATNGFKNATIDFGMGFAKTVTASDNVNDYQRFEDDGTGSLFTHEIAPCVQFDSLRFADGTTLDLNNAARAAYSPQIVKTVEGEGMIENGNVVITEALNVTTNAAGKAAKLTVDGEVVFSEGAVIRLAAGVPFVRCNDSGEVVIVEAAAIVGQPVLDASLAGNWKLVQTDMSVKLVSEVSVSGEVLDVRSGKITYKKPDWSAVSGLNKGMIWFADNKYSSGKAESAYYRGVDAPEMDSDDYSKSGYFRYTNIVNGVRVDDTGYWVSLGKSWGSESVAYSSLFNGSTCKTNATVRSIDIAYLATDLKKHPRYCVYTYTGYVWNDSTEDVVWTVASAFNDHQIWKLNGSQIYKMDSGRPAENNPERALIQLTLKPGPNAIEVRTYNQYVSTPNFYSCATNGFKNATIDFGMGFAKTVTASDNVNDYQRFEDDGTGSLFTREVQCDATGLTYQTLNIAEGATLDLNNCRGADCVYSFGTVNGVGAIRNGDVMVTSKFAIDKDDVESGKSLMVSGKLKFGEGSVVDIVGEGNLEKAVNGYVIATAEGGIEGVPVLEPSCPQAKRWTVVTDGNLIKLVYRRRGLIMIVR